MGRLDVVRLLVGQGADKDRAANDGATLFSAASQEGHLEVARLLLENGARQGRGEKRRREAGAWM